MKINTLAKSITTTAIIALTLIGIAPESHAGRGHSSHTYVSGYRSCGTPIYTERYFIGYDRCGNPIWGTRVVRSSYRPVVSNHYVAPRPTYYSHSSSYYRRDSRPRIQVQASFCR